MWRVWLILCSLLCVLSPAHAEVPECDNCERSLAPRLWIPGGDPALDQLPLKSSHADVRIHGPIAEVTITQRYANRGTRAINARYVFPGSTRAAVHALTMKVGDRVIRAQIKEKQAAAQTFEQAKREGKRAALLEQKRPNVFMMNVANLVPGDDIELTLRYSELLVPEEGVYEFVYPTVVGPRYGSDPLEGKSDAWIGNPYAADKGKGDNPVAVQTSIDVALMSPVAIKDLVSTQHKVTTNWQGETSAKLTLDAAETQPGNRDYILRFRLQDKQIMSGLMTYTHANENYFLLMAQPPARVAAQQVLPREYVFVLDVSGSMHGFPLDTAKRLMTDLLGGLRPHESFNILFFSGGASVLAPQPLPATPENLQRALRMMQSHEGGGGTELRAALEQAYAMPRDAAIARSIVVVTDGFIGAEREVYDLIGKHLNHTNLFAFGVGSSVNRYLIESMAKAGAGEPFVITDSSQAAEVSARFRRYIETPLLSDIQLRGEKVELYDLEPPGIPLMLGERPIVIFGKYRGNSAGAALRLSGKSASGNYQVNLPLTGAQSPQRAELLPILWARHRLMRISDSAGQESDAQRNEIIELGLRYCLLTRHTSFVAVDEIVANKDAPAKDVKQPLPLPQGVSTMALAATPMPEPEMLWLVMTLLALMYALHRRQRAGHARV